MFKAVAALSVAALVGLAPVSEPAAECQTCPEQRPRCRAVRACAEAYFLLRRCGFVGLDADRDGIPCERELCGNSPQPPPTIPARCAPRDPVLSRR